MLPISTSPNQSRYYIAVARTGFVQRSSQLSRVMSRSLFRVYCSSIVTDILPSLEIAAPLLSGKVPANSFYLPS